MRHHTSRLGATVFLLCSITAGHAQNGEWERLQVEVKSGAVSMQYGLELYEAHSHQKVSSAEPHADGSFTLRHVPYGDYQLLIVDAAGNTIHQQYITIGSLTPALSIDISLPHVEKAPAGPISVTQLLHPPSRKAFQAMKTAQKFSEAGDFEKAAEKLREAVALSPDYAEAHTNLGVQYIRMGRFEDARAELSRALEIGGPNVLVLTDLSAALLGSKKFVDAAGTARRALQLESGYAPAHYMLGIALCTNNTTVPDGILHLRQAAATMPAAQRELERIRKAMVR